MDIRLIDFGGIPPQRAHYNDAGADVFARIPEGTLILKPNSITAIPTGFGLVLPDGLTAYIVPRSGVLKKLQLTTELSPVDSGYRGEIHIIVHNVTDKPVEITNGMKLAQLVIHPVIIANFIKEDQKQRKENNFGSTGLYKIKGE